MSRGSVPGWVFVLAMVCAGADTLAAQIGGGVLTGTVADQAGRPVPGATVTAIAVTTGGLRLAVTDANGRYTVPGLASGPYDVRVELSGFRTLTRSGIVLATGETIPLDLQLSVGAVTESITVTGDAPLLRTESASLGQVIDNRKVVDLPLNGRSFITLAGLAPASRCRRDRRCRASTAAGRAPTNTSSTASRCCSPSRARSRSFRTSTRFRNSRSKATARPPSSAASTAASST